MHPHRATIAPVPDGVVRPLWSVMIPTYHCARFLEKTLTSVLEQDPGPAVMQIQVVDDCSTKDDPEAVVRDVGRGRVDFYRQPQNRGHVRNFQTCLERSRGQLVHLLHGDDYIQPGFYARMGAAFDEQPDIGLATCRHLYATADGNWFGISPLRQTTRGVWPNALEALVVQGDVQTPSVVVRRAVYEALDAFDERLLCTEDYEMWARIAAHYPVWYEPECLAVYRFHGGSNSARDAVTAESTRDARRAVALMAEYAEPRLAPDWRRRALQRHARYAMERAARFLEDGNPNAALLVLREALQTDAGAGTLARGARALMRALWRAAVRPTRG